MLIISVISEKLIKNRIMNTLPNFQNGGMRGKCVVNNLFILRGIIDHAMYLGKQLWVAFYDS